MTNSEWTKKGDKIPSVLKRSNHWETRRTIWPYPNGYGTYNAKARILLDVGLSPEEAQARCRELNARGQS